MRVRLVAAPGRISKVVAAHVFSLDRSIFKSCAPPILVRGAWWWLVYEGGIPVAFAGLEHYHTNRGHLLRAGVLPSVRGRGLQRRLIRARDGFARKLGFVRNITYTCSDSHAGIASANNLIACGYRMFLSDANELGWIHWYKDL